MLLWQKGEKFIIWVDELDEKAYVLFKTPLLTIWLKNSQFQIEHFPVCLNLHTDFIEKWQKLLYPV